jgi:citrate lyase beta subunit
MVYLPHVLTQAEVPEARALIPVARDGQQQGTIIVRVTDEVFDADNLDHVKVANDIEIRLADQDLLPRFVDL